MLMKNECFKWCLVRCLHPADHHPGKISKSDKDFAKSLDFKDIKFPVKIRDVHKISKKNSINISVFVSKGKKKYPVCVLKNIVKINMLIYY